MKEQEKSSKLLVFHVSTADTWRGGEQQVVYLYESFESRNIPQVIFCAENGELEKYCRYHRLKYISCKKRRSGIDLFFSHSLAKHVKKFDPSIIHLHDSHAHTAALIASLIFGLKQPMVLSRRVDFPIGGNWFSQFKYNFKQVRRIITVSNAINRIVRGSIKIKSKVITVHSGIKPNRDFNRLSSRKKLEEITGIRPEEKIVGNTAALEDHKDLFTFIDTAKILIERGSKYQFVIIGEGSLRKELEQYAKTNQVSDKIHFPGFRKDSKELLAGFDVFFISSKTEGLGTSILDALAVNVPVIGTTAGGIPEIIENNVTGLVSSPGDCIGLADQITRVLENKELALSLTRNGQEKLRGFTVEAMAESTEKIYLDVINENP